MLFLIFVRLDQIDLAFLHLAVSKNGSFNEQDLANSELGYLGVGRTLDKLAYLKENNLIQLSGSSFVITDTARQILWDKDTPLRMKILRLLQVKSFEESDIAKYLMIPPNMIQTEIDNLRKEGLLIFTTIKKDEKIIKICEIMQEGINHTQNQTSDLRSELLKSLDVISAKIKNSKIDEQKLREILEKLDAISTELD